MDAAGKHAFLRRLDRATMAAGRGLAVFGLLLLTFFAVMTNADGLMRYFLDSPIDAVRDLGGNVVAIAAACCIPYAVLERSHITMKFVGRVFGPRANFVADLFGGAVAQIVLIGIAWEFFLFGLHSAQNGDTTWMLGVPTAPFWFVVDAVFWFSVLAQAVMILRILRGDNSGGAEGGRA